MILEVGALSDLGRAREGNEDYLGMYREQPRSKGELFLVADGVGGHHAGEVASRTAVEQVVQVYADPQRSPGRDLLAELVNAVTVANSAVYALGHEQEGRQRMGSTLVGALVYDHNLYVINVGDSRAYLVRGRRAEQVSQDHSLVAEQVRLGLVDAARAKELSYRSAITRALGSQPEVSVDTFARVLQAGDVIVLCTDGLSGQVTDEEIASVVSSQAPAQAVASLVDLANERGGPDNITAIVICAHEERGADRARAETRRSGQVPTRKRGLGWLTCSVAALALTLVILLAFALLTLRREDVALPRKGPVIAPVELTSGQTPAERDEAARVLGYADEADLLIKASLLPGQAWPALRPKTVYVLLVGRVVSVKADQACPFVLRMGEQLDYNVDCGGVSANFSLAEGDQVSLLGSMIDEPARRVRPLVVDVRVRQSLLDSGWRNLYTALKPGQRLLIFTVVSPYTLGVEGQDLAVNKHKLAPDDWVAVYGPWDALRAKTGYRSAGLTSLDRVFKLDGDGYKQVNP